MGEKKNTHAQGKVAESKTRRILQPPVVAGSGLYLHQERAREKKMRTGTFFSLSPMRVERDQIRQQTFKMGKGDSGKLFNEIIQAVEQKLLFFRFRLFLDG